MAIPSQYRRQIYIGGRYLEDRELNTLQTFYLSAEEQGLGAVYREGATFNVSVDITGTTVTLFPTDNTLPMLVFLDGRFEPFTADPLSYASDVTPGTYSIYANYEIAIISAGPLDDTHDPTLIDTLTGAATAEAGQLNIFISVLDTSSTPLDPTTQVEVNTYPIIMFNILVDGLGNLTVGYLDNVNAQALASEFVSGLVSTTTGNPVVVATDDPRNIDARDPLDGSVVNDSIAELVPSGTNGDGSPITPVTGGPGLSSDNLIYSTMSTTVTWVIDNIKSGISSILATLASHIGVPLGSGATHPMPTALQVGAAPLSHVGQPLDLSTSHPPLIQTSSDAWEVVTTGSNPNNFAFDARIGSAIQAGITHGGDIYSLLANNITATPANMSFYSGPLGKLSNIALLLSQLAAQPLVSLVGYATIAYVDTTEASILAASEAYTNGLHYPMQERLFLGYFTNGQKVDAVTLATSYVSPITGYQYHQSDVQFYECELVSTRAPVSTIINGNGRVDPGQSNTNSAGHNYWLWWTQSNVNESTQTVFLEQGYIFNGDQSELDFYSGYCKVFVTVARA